MRLTGHSSCLCSWGCPCCWKSSGVVTLFDHPGSWASNSCLSKAGSLSSKMLSSIVMTWTLNSCHSPSPYLNACHVSSACLSSPCFGSLLWGYSEGCLTSPWRSGASSWSCTWLRLLTWSSSHGCQTSQGSCRCQTVQTDWCQLVSYPTSWIGYPCSVTRQSCCSYPSWTGPLSPAGSSQGSLS